VIFNKVKRILKKPTKIEDLMIGYLERFDEA